MKVTDLELDAEQLDNKCQEYFFWRTIPDNFTGKCFIIDEDVYVWLSQGKRFHRLDGPAMKFINGHQQFWINDKKYSQLEFFRHPLVIENTIENILKL